jgi:hypothetical protein
MNRRYAGVLKRVVQATLHVQDQAMAAAAGAGLLADRDFVRDLEANQGQHVVEQVGHQDRARAYPGRNRPPVAIDRLEQDQVIR